MSMIKKQMENFKDDLQKGMKKTQCAMKDTMQDLKDDAKGVMTGMQMKKDEMMEENQKEKQPKFK